MRCGRNALMETVGRSLCHDREARVLFLAFMDPQRSHPRGLADSGKKVASLSIAVRGAERTRNKVSNGARRRDKCCFGLLDFAAF